MKKRIISTVCVMFLGLAIIAQEKQSEFQHFLTVKTQISRIGGVLNDATGNIGNTISGQYSARLLSAKYTFMYEGELALSSNFNQAPWTKGIFKPLDFYFGFNIPNKRDVGFAIGPYSAAGCLWNSYPNGEGESVFWLSSLELGSRFLISVPLKKKILEISISNSIAGLNSGTDLNNEAENYSAITSDFIIKSLKDMEFSFQNTYSHFNLGLNWVNPDKRFSIGYEYERFDFPKEDFNAVSVHSLSFTLRLGRN